MTLIFILAAVFAVLLYATIEYSLLIPVKKGLPILMYHKISQTDFDDLTVALPTLERQFAYMKKKAYQCLSFAQINEFKQRGEPIPDHSVVITFDDGYQNNFDFLIPLLKKYDMKATIFLPLSHLGKVNSWDKGNDPLMTVDTIKQISQLPYIELGVHSYAHHSYKHLSLDQIDDDLKRCETFISENKIEVVRVLAYPYGATKRKTPDVNIQMKELLLKYGYWFGLRIGNRINGSKLGNPLELCRIDVKGGDRFFEFIIKLKKGRTKLF